MARIGSIIDSAMDMRERAVQEHDRATEEKERLDEQKESARLGETFNSMFRPNLNRLSRGVNFEFNKHGIDRISIFRTGNGDYYNVNFQYRTEKDGKEVPSSISCTITASGALGLYGKPKFLEGRGVTANQLYSEIQQSLIENGLGRVLWMEIDKQLVKMPEGGMVEGAQPRPGSDNALETRPMNLDATRISRLLETEGLLLAFTSPWAKKFIEETDEQQVTNMGYCFFVYENGEDGGVVVVENPEVGAALFVLPWKLDKETLEDFKKKIMGGDFTSADRDEFLAKTGINAYIGLTRRQMAEKGKRMVHKDKSDSRAQELFTTELRDIIVSGNVDKTMATTV